MAKDFFAGKGLKLKSELKLQIGVNGTKPHAFDLGCEDRKVIVECKSHSWTDSGNVPSAKMSTWNEAMYYFHAAPPGYRKILFVRRDLRGKQGESLAQYYIQTYSHLIPNDVEVWEYDVEAKKGTRLR